MLFYFAGFHFSALNLLLHGLHKPVGMPNRFAFLFIFLLLKAAAEGDKEIAATVDAFHYQIGKEVGAMAAVMKGKVDQIILTGGIAYGQETVDAITDMVGWIAPITVYPGEDELLALAQGALRVLNGEEPARVY